MDWQGALTQLLTFAIGSGLLVFLAQSIFSQFLSRDIERFKQFLSRDIERFKSELNTATFEHETRYARLHEDRARVIEQLYGLLVDAHEGLSAFAAPLQVGGDEKRKEQAEQTANKLNEFFTCFHKKDIYLDPSFCSLIGSLETKFRRIMARFCAPWPPADEWIVAWQELERDVPPIKEGIANRFRQILGVRSEQRQPEHSD